MVVDPAYGALRQADSKLSYKFQRLREQLRSAILSGEFHQRLPGERELGRRYGANAKTINKALCDLSSEGLLVRRIGRGTYVMSSGGETPAILAGKMFRVVIPSQQSSPLVHKVFEGIQARLSQRGHLLDWHVLERPNESPKPGWLGAAGAAMGGIFIYRGPTLRGDSPPFGDAVLADILRRHVPTVVVGGEMAGLKFNTVAPDYSDAGFRLAEHLCQLGSQGIVAVTGTTVTREGELLIQGARTSSIRMQRPFEIVPIGALGAWAAEQIGKRDANAGAPEFGILCVGSESLSQLRQNQRIASMVANGTVRVAAGLDVGESDLPEASNVARYDVSLDRVLDWGVREMLDYRVGHRPVEIVVPGVVRPGLTESGGRTPGATPSTYRHGEVSDSFLTEAVIS